MYQLAFLQNDAAAMREQVAWARGKPGSEDFLLYLQSNTEAYYGRLPKAREFTRQAVDSAMHNDAKEVAATYEAYAAVREAEFGDKAQAHQDATAALALFPEGQDVRSWAALALAQIGDAQQCQRLVNRLNNNFPNDTVVQGYWLPSVRATIEVAHGNASKAIELLQAASFLRTGWAGAPAARLCARPSVSIGSKWNSRRCGIPQITRPSWDCAEPALRRTGASATRQSSHFDRRHRERKSRLSGLPHPLERCRPRHPHPERSQSGVREAAVSARKLPGRRFC